MSCLIEFLQTGQISLVCTMNVIVRLELHLLCRMLSQYL